MLRRKIPRFLIISLLAISLPTISACTPNGEAPGVVYASVSVKCGGDVYTVSTGNNSGKCETTEGPEGHGAHCTSGGGGASMTCKGGVGKCLESEGSGSCSIKAN